MRLKPPRACALSAGFTLEVAAGKQVVPVVRRGPAEGCSVGHRKRVLSANGHPLFRTSAETPDYASAFDDVVLSHLLAGMRAAMTASTPVLPVMTLFAPMPETSIDGALAASAKTGRPPFVIIYDAGHGTMSNIAYRVGYFVEYPHTRQALQDAFTVAVVHRAQPGVEALLDSDGPLEEAVWVVLDGHGNVVQRGDVYANPKEGERIIRSAIENAKRSVG